MKWARGRTKCCTSCPSGNPAAAPSRRCWCNPARAILSAPFSRCAPWVGRARRGFAAPVYDGSDLYEVRARQVAASEAVAVDAGNFQATKISLRLFERGKEVPHASFLVWFAHNAARTPVLVVAEMPLGNVRVELVAAPK